MKCWWCEREIDEYKEGHYVRWSLAMPAHITGYLCVDCYDKKWGVRIKKFLGYLWKKIQNKA